MMVSQTKLGWKVSFVLCFLKGLYRIYLRSYVGMRSPLCGNFLYYEFNAVKSNRDIQIFCFFLDQLGEFVSFKECFVR